MSYDIPTTSSPQCETLPWGSYTVLEEANDFKVKKIEVLPRKRLNYQRHTQREGHWIIINGVAHVTLNGREIYLGRGERIHIPKGAVHRLENPEHEALILVEVQLGNYLREDDFERFQDDLVQTNV